MTGTKMARKAAKTTMNDKDEVTCDAFHRGAFELYQPVTGHRSGMDAMLLGASLPDGAAGQLADLGSATGAAAFAALAMNEGLSATLVDQDPKALELANRSFTLRANDRFRGRAKTLLADVTLSGERREAAGLQSDSFDYVIMNPPYNEPTLRPSPDPARAGAHVMGIGGLDAWMRTAVAILKPGGVMSMIYRTQSLGEIIACCQSRFGNLRLLPIHSRHGEGAKRLIVQGVKGSKGPLTIMPGIVMHDNEGRPTEMAETAINGEARLCLDD